MSRSGYSDDFDQWTLIRWRGAVKSAICGKRGQAFLREMLAALDALPKKELVAEDLQNSEGVCALGSVGLARKMDMTGIDPHDYEQVVKAFGIPESLAREIEFENDDGSRRHDSPEQRFNRMRQWVVSHIKDLP